MKRSGSPVALSAACFEKIVSRFGSHMLEYMLTESVEFGNSCKDGAFTAAVVRRQPAWCPVYLYPKHWPPNGVEASSRRQAPSTRLKRHADAKRVLCLSLNLLLGAFCAFPARCWSLQNGVSNLSPGATVGSLANDWAWALQDGGRSRENGQHCALSVLSQIVVRNRVSNAHAGLGACTESGRTTAPCPTDYGRASDDAHDAVMSPPRAQYRSSGAASAAG